MNKNKPLSTQNKSLLDEFYENLKSSKRPLAIFGHGCRLSGSHKLVSKLIQHLSIPSVFTWNASDLLPFNDDLYVGKPGNVALRAPNIAIQTCDIFISFGARLDNIVTAYDSKNFARNAKNKYLVDIDKFQMSKSDISYAKNICLDFKLAAEYLLQREPLKEIKNWKEHCKNLKNKFSVCDGKIPKDSKKITHLKLLNI